MWNHIATCRLLLCFLVFAICAGERDVLIFQCIPNGPNSVIRPVNNVSDNDNENNNNNDNNSDSDGENDNTVENNNDNYSDSDCDNPEAYNPNRGYMLLDNHNHDNFMITIMITLTREFLVFHCICHPFNLLLSLY